MAFIRLLFVPLKSVYGQSSVFDILIAPVYHEECPFNQHQRITLGIVIEKMSRVIIPGNKSGLGNLLMATIAHWQSHIIERLYQTLIMPHIISGRCRFQSSTGEQKTIVRKSKMYICNPKVLC